MAGFPDRAARPEAVEWLNRASRWYPRPVVWLVAGVVALLVRRGSGAGSRSRRSSPRARS